MKLEKWALIAEIVGAAAIVISLFFVGLQVRQGNDATVANTQAIQSQVLQTMMNAEVDFLAFAVDYPYLARIDYVPEGNEDPIASRAAAYFFAMLRSREQAWRQLQSGVLDEATYRSYTSVLVLMIQNSPYYRQLWQSQVRFETVISDFASDIDAEAERRINPVLLVERRKVDVQTTAIVLSGRSPAYTERQNTTRSGRMRSRSRSLRSSWSGGNERGNSNRGS